MLGGGSMVRKLVVCLAIIAILMVPAVTWATPSYVSTHTLPADATRQAHWEYNSATDTWIKYGADSTGNNARAWVSGKQYKEFTSCNGPQWELAITNHASIAHWCKWKMSATRWDWRIRKPGKYIMDGLVLAIYSNQDIVLSHQGFGNLLCTGDVWKGTAIPEIAAWYTWEPLQGNLPAESNWKTGAAFNGDMTVPFNRWTNGWGWEGHLFTKLEVDNFAQSCEYERASKITIKVVNQKDWIAEGTWKDDPV
jgi:hypothetical protein